MASKRSRSPSPGGPDKRARLSLESALSEELLCRILSFLPLNDLMAVAEVSRSWERLSRDPQLWRSLFRRDFASSSASSSRSSRTRHTSLLDQRPPGSRPWRELYKISFRWRQGSARRTMLSRLSVGGISQGGAGRTASALGVQGQSAMAPELAQHVRAAVLPRPPSTDFIAPEVPAATPHREPVVVQRPTPVDTLLAFHGRWFFTASRSRPEAGSGVPQVQVHETQPSGASVLVGQVGSARIAQYWEERRLSPGMEPADRIAITEVQLDQTLSEVTGAGSARMVRLAVFYSTSQFALFAVTLPHPSMSSAFAITELYTSLSTSLSNDHVAVARLSHPILATCTASYRVRFYLLREDAGALEVEELEPSFQSQEAEIFSPLMMSITSRPGAALGGSLLDEGAVHKHRGKKRVTLAYTKPVFPSGWTVGVQEFAVRLPSSTSSSTAAALASKVRISARHATAALLGRHAALHDHAASQVITSLSHAAPWVVASRSDNTISVFRISEETSTSGRTELRVALEKTLFGHSAAVGAVCLSTSSDRQLQLGSVATGRCVSGGRDGVKVWQLESDVGRESGRQGAVDVYEEAEEVTLSAEATMTSPWSASWSTPHGHAGGGRVSPVPSRVKSVYFDEEKIVSVVEDDEQEEGVHGGRARESVKLLRFD